MNLYIFSALVPLSMGFFVKSEKLSKGLNIFSVLVGVGALVATAVLKPDIPLMIPSMALLLIYAVNKLQDKVFDPYELLGTLIACQALLTTKLGEILALALTVDLLFSLTQKNVKKYFYFALTWLPLIGGALVNEKSEILDVLAALTIILRSFDWPIRIIPRTDLSEIQEFISRVVIPIALWKSLDISMPLFWVGFWMAMPLFFAWGASSRTVLLLTSLSLWTTSSPSLGMVSVALWPAYFLVGPWVSWFVVLAAFNGVLANVQPLGLMEEIGWALIGLEAFVIARVLTALLLEKQKAGNKEMAAYVVISLGVLGGASQFIPVNDINWKLQGLVFAGLVLVLTVAGYFLSKKGKKLFSELKSFQPVEGLNNWVQGTKIYNLKSFPQTKFWDSAWVSKMFEAIESEGYIFVLIAIIAGFFLWGIK